jgi:diadenosine tetraphosphate (Ap4A) HIT family hydrolase
VDAYRNQFQIENSSVENESDVIISGTDPFCNPEIIQKQLVFEGSEVNVLYNYAPIGLGQEKLHFLIVPKIHRVGFSELSQTEYLEAMELSQKLINFYQKRNHPIVYVFHKTGVEAGQTVPHWHQHIVFAETGAQEFFSKMAVLKNMMIGASPLSSEELKGRVQLLRTDLQEAMKN